MTRWAAVVGWYQGATASCQVPVAIARSKRLCAKPSYFPFSCTSHSHINSCTAHIAVIAPPAHAPHGPTHLQLRQHRLSGARGGEVRHGVAARGAVLCVRATARVCMDSMKHATATADEGGKQRAITPFQHLLQQARSLGAQHPPAHTDAL